MRTVATSTTPEWNVLAVAYAGRADRLALLESRLNPTTTERVMRVVDVATGVVGTTFPQACRH